MLFSFVFDTETKQAAMAGNIDTQTALGIFQQLVIADAINKARDNGSKELEPAIK